MTQHSYPGQTTGLVRMILQLEGLALAAAGLWLYFGHFELSGWLFLLFILAPDVALFAYIAGARVGAHAYNATHTYIVPLLLITTGMTMSFPVVLTLGLAWLIHIAVDRAIGYGLKYPSAFKRTHLAASA
jgi:hypothetical protein